MHVLHDQVVEVHSTIEYKQADEHPSRPDLHGNFQSNRSSLPGTLDPAVTPLVLNQQVAMREP